MKVQYVELRGGEDTARLRALLHELRPLAGFAGGELLASPDQPGLALLQLRWSGQVPVVTVEGARVWVFEVLEAVGPGN